MVTSAYCGKTADSIEMPFVKVSGVGQRKGALDARTHWRHMANTVEQLCTSAMSWSATKGGDTACSKITLGSLVDVNYRVGSKGEARGSRPQSEICPLCPPPVSYTHLTLPTILRV